jgi:hypothetical protein
VLGPPTYARTEIPVLNPRQVLKTTPASFELYQFDNIPVGDRTPLLLIHGLWGENRRLFRWDQVCRYLASDEDFCRRYKIYLARFDTHARLNILKPLCQDAIRRLSAETNSRPLVVITLSLSGNVVREAMTEPDIDCLVQHVVAMGGLFQGSPLFCSDWMQRSMLHRRGFILRRIDRYLAYKLFFAHHENLLADYQWDNVDASVPPFSLGPEKNKFTVYAAYLPDARSNGKQPLRALLSKVIFFVYTTVPAHWKDEHAVLRILHQEMSELVFHGDDPQQRRFAFTDGIAPIASTLFLTKDVTPGGTKISLDDAEKLKGAVQAANGRLFENVDHAMFMQEHRRFRRPLVLTDQLSPAEPARPLFAWLLHDLLVTGSEDRELRSASSP